MELGELREARIAATTATQETRGAIATASYSTIRQQLEEGRKEEKREEVEQRTKQDSSFEEPPLPSSMASLLSLSAPIPSVARLELISGSLSSSLIIH
ncbi:hypothetical protein CRG98_020029 [Punica granatum]|uniref:Uncharacterized protein n=1 Tax=Punica granatum TaxID=22663 RepID=A0A2I0JUP8_PUNGR|nr:hypothetical protein CRG98_020029 [Punica granatum]